MDVDQQVSAAGEEMLQDWPCLLMAAQARISETTLA